MRRFELWVSVALCMGLSACGLLGTSEVDRASDVYVSTSVTEPAQSGWEPVRLPGKAQTSYSASFKAGVPAWFASADHSASMWRHRLDIPPEQLGGLGFSWWVDGLVAGADLSRAGMGDSPARLVLAFDGNKAALPARERLLFDIAEALTGEAPPYATLMYVWANQQPPETVVIHPRTSRIRKLVLEQGPKGLRQWRHYQRNLASDFRRVYGEEPGRLIGVALMTDADNLGTTARAWYGEIQFQGQSTLAPPPK